MHDSSVRYLVENATKMQICRCVRRRISVIGSSLRLSAKIVLRRVMKETSSLDWGIVTIPKHYHIKNIYRNGKLTRNQCARLWSIENYRVGNYKDGLGTPNLKDFPAGHRA